MKFSVFNRSLFLLLLAVLVPAWPAFSAEPPQAVIEKAFTAMKQKESVVGFFEFIDWDAAYLELDPRRRMRYAVKNGHDLRSYLTEAYTDPAARFRKNVRASFNGLTEEEREREMASNEAYITHGMNQIERFYRTANSKYVRANYEIGDARFDGDIAFVTFKATVDGETESTEIDMIRREGVWRVRSVQLFD